MVQTGPTFAFRWGAGYFPIVSGSLYDFLSIFVKSGLSLGAAAGN